MNETLIQAAALIVPLIFAIVFHEGAHGLAARALGDPTAAQRGRLSLNPFRHVDPFGTVILPGMLALMKAPILGWAKPVPVNFMRLGNPKRDMMFVGAAGPAMNFVMAAVGAVVLGLLVKHYGQDPQDFAGFIALNLVNFLLINVFLAMFNLLPIPPFDGSRIVMGLLPDELARPYARLERYGLLIVLGLVVVLPYLVPGFNLIGKLVWPPVEWALGHYFALAAAVAGGGLPGIS